MIQQSNKKREHFVPFSYYLFKFFISINVLASIIIPAKVYPVIPEEVNQVCFKIIGNDVTIAMAAETGQSEYIVEKGKFHSGGSVKSNSDKGMPN